MTTEDVYSSKKAFIEAQVRRLTTTITPSRDFKAASAAVEDNERLSDTVIENAIYKVNLALRKHYRLQYSAQAIRHVASQIDELYRARLNADQETGIQGGENAMLLEILSGNADFTDPKVISQMPDVWPKGTPEEQQRYGELLGELQSLSTTITAMERKKKYYDSLLSLAEETLGDPKKTVQPNLVTKSGPIADELRKMRTLLAKVTDHLNTAHIQLKPDDSQTTEPEEMDIEKWDELSRVLEKVNEEPSHP